MTLKRDSQPFRITFRAHASIRGERLETGQSEQSGRNKNGLKSYILNKIKDTIYRVCPQPQPFGQKNIILKGKYGYPPILAQLRRQERVENLNNNFELKFRMNHALREEFNVHTLCIRYSLFPSAGGDGNDYGNAWPFLGRSWSVGAAPSKLGALKGTKIFFHTSCRAVNRIGPHNTDIISTIFGLLLGDGYAINRTGEGVRISIKQSIIHKEYLFSLYEFFFLRGYCSNLIPRKYNRTIKGIDKIYSGYEFNTFTFRSFVWIYNSFYKNGKKILPLNMEEFITPLTLAI